MIKKLLNFTILFSTILLLSNFSFAYLSSTPQTNLFSTFVTQPFSSSSCQQGQDFLIQIAPFGCTPAVVRSDLLEQNDVPVYCQLGATQINPLIDVQSIDSLSFSGKYSPEVSGVGFYPAQAALGVQGNLNSPVLNNIGYAVINLKKQPNESAMPDYVYGNLTARIKYNVKNAYGIGNALFYLPELSSSDWNDKKSQYSFWSGKGYLKADSISSTSADISVYTDSGLDTTVTLKAGQTSNNIYIPGFECQAGFKLQLQSMENPDTAAQLRVNADNVEASQGETFLDNKCSVQSLNSNGLVQQATVRCQEDSGINAYSLSVSPKIILNIDGENREVGAGDKLFDYTDPITSVSRSVYLGYLGTNGNLQNKNNLVVYFVSFPSPHADKLTNDELASTASLFLDFKNAGIKPAGVIDQVSDSLKGFFGLTNSLSRAIISGEVIYPLNYGENPSDVFGKSVSIIDFAGAQDQELTGAVKEDYDNAVSDYESVIKSFSSEPYPTGTTYGEEALYSEIQLASDANQKKTAAGLCDEFTKDYPSSTKNLDDYCSGYKLSNSDTNSVSVTINKQVYKISLDGISEPSFADYGATVIVSIPGVGSVPYDLTKDETVYLTDGTQPSSAKDYIKLISLDNNSAQVMVSTSSKTSTIKLAKDVAVSFDSTHSITLQKINLKKSAKVSLISNINNAGTSANFSFKIGIEKRAVDLAPDQIKSLINTLNGSIDQWSKISGTLGNVTQGLKTACLATGTGLIIKNFLLNTGGAGIARQSVMGGINGWTEKCTSMVSEGKYSSLDNCFLQNANQIDSDTQKLTDIISQQNSEIQSLQSGAITKQFMGESVVDTNAFMQQYAPQVSSYLQTSDGFASALTDPSGKGQAINKNEILTDISGGYADKIYSTDQLKEIELYSKVLDDPSSSDELKNIAKSTIYSDLTAIKNNAGNFAAASTLASSVGVSASQIGFLEVGKNVKSVPYEGLTLAQTGKSITGIDPNTPVYLAQTSDGNTYLYILDNSAGTSKLPIKRIDNLLQIYDFNSMNLVTNPSPDLTNLYFQTYNSATYKNQYKNPTLSYFETAPYQGLPAIVPFDLTNGWYAAIKQTLPVGANIQSYDASSRVSSFYLCNVGPNGIEEFNTVGDDTCEMINTGTGQPYNQFPGLSESDATSLVNKAVQAIEQASKLYKSGLSGKVTILGQTVDVGSPALNLPQLQCQDFMSPKDCLVLFNVCDPVICPSSRCDLGGAYPVKDVIQSGVIGSIALCLPNAREGIVMPVCLTGVKAGIDGFLSVQKSFRDCLQESLDTGKTVGVCDEIYSVYLCDFFYQQALPLTSIAIPKIVETLFGQNVRGGGEYLGIANALSVAQNSVSYFTNYYGTSAVDSFKARVSEIGTDICKSSISAVLPTGADLVNTLTKPDSPVQFTGRFDETQLTTVTVPPTSDYKVFYHIYAGEDSGAYYQVYLKGSSGSSYYQDTSQNLVIASGYVAVSDYASDTVDKIAPSGYKQLCINVNGQEECGFQEVSTSFALNYIKDNYLSSQANQTQITTESECVSGTPSIYSATSLNAQSAASSLINPAIYNQGIVRICATANPGQGTDPYAGTQNSRWVEVGYCDNPQIKCWIDTQSVENVIKTTTIQNATLDSLSQNYGEILANQNGYMTDDQFSSALQQINDEQNASDKITLVNQIIGKVFLDTQKVQLYYIRGNAYADIARIIFPQQPISVSATTPASSPQEIPTMTELQQNVLTSAKDMVGTSASRTVYSNCWEAAYQVYKNAGVGAAMVYSDLAGKRYTITNQRTSNQAQTITVGVPVDKNGYFSSDGQINFIVYSSKLNSFNTNSDQKLSMILPGYIISYAWNGQEGHNAVFISWKDQANHIANLFDWNGGNAANPLFEYYTEDLSDDVHPVYVIWKPYVQSQVDVSNTGVSSGDLNQTPPIQSTTTTSSVATANTASVGDRIFQNAMDIANSPDSKNYSTLAFVGKVLTGAGISGISSGVAGSNMPSSLTDLISGINSSSSFSEIVDTTNVKPGDVVIIGHGCTLTNSIGIVGSVDNLNMFVYTNTGNGIALETLPDSLAISADDYPSKIYRYTADLSAGDISAIKTRTKWTLFNAINYITNNNLTGIYEANQQFVDQLIFDGLLTESECNTVRRTPSGVQGVYTAIDMTWLKNLLLSKCVSDSACKQQMISSA